MPGNGWILEIQSSSVSLSDTCISHQANSSSKYDRVISITPLLRQLHAVAVQATEPVEFKLSVLVNRCRRMSSVVQFRGPSAYPLCFIVIACRLPHPTFSHRATELFRRPIPPCSRGRTLSVAERHVGAVTACFHETPTDSSLSPFLFYAPPHRVRAVGTSVAISDMFLTNFTYKCATNHKAVSPVTGQFADRTTRGQSSRGLAN